jgi:hypothetical protein
MGFLAVLRRIWRNEATPPEHRVLDEPIDRVNDDGDRQYSLDGGDTWDEGPIPPWPWPKDSA